MTGLAGTRVKPLWIVMLNQASLIRILREQGLLLCFQHNSELGPQSKKDVLRPVWFPAVAAQALEHLSA